MSNKSNATVATMGIDIGKNSFHVVGLDQRGAIVLRQKWSRGQIEARLAAMPPCLIGMEACVGAHHLSRKLRSYGMGATVLDLGCGPGRPVAQHMADLGLRVTGVDSSPTMISFCRARLPDHEWIVADMRQLALGWRFDGTLAWDSFFHLNHYDQRRMFTIFGDHASDGTVLMFNTGPQHGEGVGEYRGDPLYHASLAPTEYEALAERFGFDVIQQATNDPTAGGRTVWLYRRRELG